MGQGVPRDAQAAVKQQLQAQQMQSPQQQAQGSQVPIGWLGKHEPVQQHFKPGAHGEVRSRARETRNLTLFNRDLTLFCCRSNRRRIRSKARRAARRGALPSRSRNRSRSISPRTSSSMSSSS